MNHFTIHLKLTQYCKSTILKHKIKNKQENHTYNQHGLIKFINQAG